MEALARMVYSVGNPVKSDEHFALPRPDTRVTRYIKYQARKVHYYWYRCTLSTLPLPVVVTCTGTVYYELPHLVGEYKHHCGVLGAGIL